MPASLSTFRIQNHQRLASQRHYSLIGSQMTSSCALRKSFPTRSNGIRTRRSASDAGSSRRASNASNTTALSTLIYGETWRTCSRSRAQRAMNRTSSRWPWQSLGRPQFFVTRDDRLLERGDEVARRWGLVFLRPSGLVGQSYEQRREGLYRPGRLAGTQITEARARVEELPSLTAVFLSHGSGETNSEFDRIIRNAEANPQNCEIQLFWDGAGDMAGLLVTDHAVAGLSQVRLIPCWAPARFGPCSPAPSLARGGA